MNWLAALRPRRSLVLPLLVLAVPTLYFVYRDVGIRCPTSRPCVVSDHVGYALAAVVGSYLVAAFIVALVDVPALADRHPYARLAFRPTDATLAVLGILVGAIVAYLLATLVTTVPAWLDLVLAPFGLVVGLPLVVTFGATTLAANALGREPAMGVQLAVAAASLCATGVWLFALATGTAGVLESGRALASSQ